MPPPIDLRARSAEPRDYATFARLFPQLETHDPTPPADAWEQGLAPHTTLFEIDGEVAAYTAAKATGASAYVMHVVVDAPFRRRGVAAAAMEGLSARLSAAGCTEWYLHVKTDNAAAIRLYESVGMRAAHEAISLAIPWDAALALPRDARLRACDVRADARHDVAIETALALPPGRIAGLRENGSLVLVRAEDESGQHVGFAAFDPRFPGAMPFCVAHPDAAPALLHAMRPHGLPEHDFVRLVVYGCPALVARLHHAGASTLMEMFVMRGPLPRGLPSRSGTT
jgi:GNAT superfamily N-acetyltransferase